MADQKSDSSGAIAPPPVIGLILIAVGVAIGLIWPVEIIPAPWQYVAGGPIIAGAVLLVLSAFRLFRKAETPVPTYLTPKALVTSGVYRLTRNPIYLALLMLIVGLAVTLDNIWLIAAAALFQQIIRWGVIAREEPIPRSQIRRGIPRLQAAHAALDLEQIPSRWIHLRRRICLNKNALGGRPRPTPPHSPASAGGVS